MKFNIKGSRVRDRYHGELVLIGGDPTPYVLKYTEGADYDIFDSKTGELLAAKISYGYIRIKIDERIWKKYEIPIE